MCTPGTTSGRDNACSEASCQMMAPESLQDGIFSDKNDVVSKGVGKGEAPPHFNPCYFTAKKR